jgi:hypothetical protein
VDLTKQVLVNVLISMAKYRPLFQKKIAGQLPRLLQIT